MLYCLFRSHRKRKCNTTMGVSSEILVHSIRFSYKIRLLFYNFYSELSLHSVLYLSSNLHSEFELMANSTECVNLRDIEQAKGRLLNAVQCANACDLVSPLFIFGKKSTSACKEDGCECFCESNTNEDGDCLQTRVNNEYDLYRYTTNNNMGEGNLKWFN